ncbi:MULTISPECIES: hypothetical protein [unclassified Aeromicrobium]|uniref:hypothetical protein n=1 Tax=unclassified Aeromicrobium TaxID=2633570 RepID=UPI002889A216|nr:MULTISPECIES: hypothetical protein [unclassified Aeromicrobium]
MTNRLTVARRALVAAVAATGAPTAEVLPVKVNSSTLISFAPASDYVDQADTFGGDLKMRVYAYALVKPKNDRHDAETLDGLLVALHDGSRASSPPWFIEAVDEPDVLKYGEWVMYGTRLTLTTTL